MVMEQVRQPRVYLLKAVFVATTSATAEELILHKRSWCNRSCEEGLPQTGLSTGSVYHSMSACRLFIRLCA